MARTRLRTFCAVRRGPIGSGGEAHLELKGEAVRERVGPGVGAAFAIFSDDGILLEPAAAVAEVLIEPPAVDKGKLAVIVGCPDGMRQGVGELEKACFAELDGLLCALEADGHERAAKIGCRFDLHLAPGLASAFNALFPRRRRIDGD